MNRTTRITMATMAAVAVTAAGCGGSDDIAESLIERGIESEGGGDVQFDLDEDGGFVIETEEGRIEMSADGEGNISIEGSTDDGDISIQSEDGQMVIESDDGSAVIDTEDGSAVIDGDDGEVVIESDDGEMTIESDDGSMVISEGGDLPEGFPADVPVPSGLAIAMSQAMDIGGQQNYTVVYESADADFAEAGEAYRTALEAAGFSQQSVTETPDGGFFTYDDGTWQVSGFWGPFADDTGTSLTLSVMPSTGG